MQNIGVSKEVLETIPMYFNDQLSPIESLLLNLKSNSELTEENKKYLEDFPFLQGNENFFIERVFGSRLDYHMPSKSMGVFHRNVSVIDPNTEYVLNSNGFRGKEFSKNEKIIALGCSHTHGMGLRSDLIWINQLGKMMGLDEVSNLGVPGASLMYIVENAFKYFYEFGNPEYVVLFAPDLYRYRTTQNKKFNVTEGFAKGYHDLPFVENNWVSPISYSERKKILKQPYITSDIMPMEQIFWLNMQFLRMLVTYCRANGIKLIWTSWHMPLSNLIQVLKNEGSDLFDEFFYIDFAKFGNLMADQFNCHKDLMESSGPYFKHALDIEVAGRPHWGSHLHMHIAEEFFKRIQEV